MMLSAEWVGDLKGEEFSTPRVGLVGGRRRQVLVGEGSWDVDKAQDEVTW